MFLCKDGTVSFTSNSARNNQWAKGIPLKLVLAKPKSSNAFLEYFWFISGGKMILWKGVTIDITLNPAGINFVGSGDSFQSIFSQIKKFKCFGEFFWILLVEKNVSLPRFHHRYVFKTCGNYYVVPGYSF